MSNAEKKGLTRRIGGYFGRRFRTPHVGSIGGDLLRGGSDEARKSLEIKRIDRAEVLNAYRGRYSDGGVARFSEMADEYGLSDDDLLILESERVRQFQIMCVFAAVCFVVGFLFPFLTSDLLIVASGFVFGIFSLVFLVIGLRHDFAAWQIRNRRFGGLREYLDIRWGRNQASSRQISTVKTDLRK